MMVVPVDADDGEANSAGTLSASPCRFAVAGVFSSKAMIVMITAMTPSLKASSRCVSIEALGLDLSRASR